MLHSSAQRLKTTRKQKKNEIHLIRRKVVEDGSVKDVLHLSRVNTEFALTWIPDSFYSLGQKLWNASHKIQSILFESDSQLIRIDSYAFSSSSLQSIEIPRNVEILGSSCFCGCKSLSSISFESNSRLNRIESSAFRV
jgi:hypothetical protein